MLFQFNITLTEEDFLAFNCFHSFESTHGKKIIRKTRIFFIIAMVFLMALVVFILGWSALCITYVILLGLFTLLYMLLFKKVLIRNIKAQIKRLKKIGKLPFDPVSTIAFYEDKLAEITTSKRTELSYDAIERICVVKDRYIFLYHSSVGAYLLPVAQIREQSSHEDFFNFLSQKCNIVEYY